MHQKNRTLCSIKSFKKSEQHHESITLDCSHLNRMSVGILCGRTAIDPVPPQCIYHTSIHLSTPFSKLFKFLRLVYMASVSPYKPRFSLPMCLYCYGLKTSVAGLYGLCGVCCGGWYKGKRKPPHLRGGDLKLPI